MIRTAFIAALALVCVASNAEARQRHKATGLHKDCNILWPCAVPSASTPEQARQTRGRYIQRQMGIGGPIQKPAVRVPKARPEASYGGRSTAGIVAPLAAKVAEIQSACGSRVISAVRHTRIAGSRHMSLHASGQAVDMVGSPACIYSHLRDWPGGYSLDYGRVKHVHISYGGREHGIRFAHGGVRKYGRRHGSHSRYATAAP